MNRARSVLTLIAAGSLGGCGPGDTSLPAPTEVGLSDLEVVAPDQEFADVRAISLDGDQVWVLDGREPFVARISIAGDQPALRFGHHGAGPADLQAPRAIISSHARVEVWDFLAHRRTEFDSEGELVNVERLPWDPAHVPRADFTAVSHVDPWRVGLIGDGVAFTALTDAANQPWDLTGASVSVLDADGPTPRRLLPYRDLMPSELQHVVQFPWIPLWDTCRSDLVVWDPSMAAVRWMDPEGEQVGEVPVTPPSTRIETAQIENFLRVMAEHESGRADFPDELIATRAREVGPLFGEPTPPVSDVRCDPDDAAWLQLFDLDDDPLGRGRTWARVPRDGAVRTVRFAAPFRPLWFGRDVVLGVLTEPTADRIALWRTPAD